MYNDKKVKVTFSWLIFLLTVPFQLYDFLFLYISLPPLLQLALSGAWWNSDLHQFLLSIDTFEPQSLVNGHMKICHSTFTFLMTGATGVLGAAKTILCAATVIHPHIPESHRLSHMVWKLLAFVISWGHQRTWQIQHHLASLRTSLKGLHFRQLNKICTFIYHLIILGS